MSIAFKCSCGRGLRANPEMAGKKTKCPGCGSILTIPAASAAAAPAAPAAPKPAPAPAALPPSPAAAAAGMVTCECGAKIRTKPEWAGKLIKCPKCEAKIKVPAATPAPVAAAPRPAAKPAPAPFDDDFPASNISEEPFGGGGDFSSPGSFQDDTPADAVDDEPAAPKRKAAVAPPVKKRSRAPFLIVVLLILLAGGAFAFYAYYLSDPPVSTPPNPSLTNQKDDGGDDDDPEEMKDKKDKTDDEPKDANPDEPKDKKDIDGGLKDKKDGEGAALSILPKKVAFTPRKLPPAPVVVGGPAFDYLSGKVVAFKSFRPQALLRTGVGQMLLAKMEEGPEGEQYKAATEALGVGAQDINHVLLVLPDVPNFAGAADAPGLMIVETAKPVKEEGLDQFAQGKQLEKKATADGKSYYTLPAPKGPLSGALALVAPNLAIAGKEGDVVAFLAGKKEPVAGSIAPIVKNAATGEHLVFVGFEVPKATVDGLVKMAPPDGMKMVAPFAEARTGQLTITAGDSVKGLLALNFDDSAKAATAGKSLDDLLLFVEGGVGALAQGAKSPELEKLSKLAIAAVESIKPKVAGNSLEVPLEVNASLDRLSDLLQPIVEKMQASAERLVQSNNLKQIALAMHMYHDAFQGLPLAKAGKGGLSWRVAILPFIEQQQLLQRFKMDEPWNSPNNLKLLAAMPEVYRHPTRPAQPGHTYYRVIIGPGTIFGDGMQKTGFARIPDGTSNTFMIVEAETAVPWTKFDEVVFNPAGPLPKLGENGRFLVAFADASVQFMENVSPKDLGAYITASGGEIVDRFGAAVPPGLVPPPTASIEKKANTIFETQVDDGLLPKTKKKDLRPSKKSVPEKILPPPDLDLKKEPGGDGARLDRPADPRAVSMHAYRPEFFVRLIKSSPSSRS
jgi:hypothetical protein